jgi:hypothetical protein
MERYTVRELIALRKEYQRRRAEQLMASRRLNVEVTGDSSSVQRAFKQAGRSAEEFNVESEPVERTLKDLDTAFSRVPAKRMLSVMRSRR